MLYFIFSAIIIVADFLAKRWAAEVLQRIETIPIIEDVFHLTYVGNEGMAFGMLQGQRYFFIAVTVVVLALVVGFMLKTRNKNRVLKTGLSFALGGAAGNLIDRIWLGYVVDMFDFRLINFPVFNVADVFVCIGAFLVALYFIFYDGKEMADMKKDCE